MLLQEVILFAKRSDGSQTHDGFTEITQNWAFAYTFQTVQFSLGLHIDPLHGPGKVKEPNYRYKYIVGACVDV